MKCIKIKTCLIVAENAWNGIEPKNITIKDFKEKTQLILVGHVYEPTYESFVIGLQRGCYGQ